MNIKNNITHFNESLGGSGCRLIAISKTKPIEMLQEAYEAGQRIFGENKVQEMEMKHEALPKDIEWHMIGHLQTNKVKYIAPFVSLIHSVDSVKLLEEINKQGKKTDRIIPCLLQIYIANEKTKFGFSEEEVIDLLNNYPASFSHVQIVGLMGMATFTNNQEQIRKEFNTLKKLFDRLKGIKLPPMVEMKELSMGMSADYEIAVAEGSTFVRIGSSIFGERNHLILP
jgi:PLP dependent protein